MIVRSALYVPNYGFFGDARRLVALCEQAEESGWHGFFIWDQIHMGAEPVVDPWVVLAACAAKTTRIKLGALVTPVSRRRPVKLARELLSLDQLSCGRVVAGVGLGSAAEFDRVGERSSGKLRAAALEEGTRYLDRLLHGTEVTLPHISLNERLGPRPADGRIPVWLGMAHTRSQGARRAAALPVDGIVPMRAPWNVHHLLSADELGAVVQRVADAGARVDDVATIGRRTNPECQPIEEYAAAGMTWWLELLHHDVDSARDIDHRTRSGPPQW